MFITPAQGNSGIFPQQEMQMPIEMRSWRSLAPGGKKRSRGLKRKI
jgi:hypothetical protein